MAAAPALDTAQMEQRCVQAAVLAKALDHCQPVQSRSPLQSSLKLKLGPCQLQSHQLKTSARAHLSTGRSPTAAAPQAAPAETHHQPHQAIQLRLQVPFLRGQQVVD